MYFTFEIMRFLCKTTFKRYSSSQNLSITFFGSDLFSLETLKHLNILHRQSLIHRFNVVTSADSKINSKNKVIEFCDREKIECHYWNDMKVKLNDKFVYENTLDEYNLGLVASFGHIIPSRLINLFKYGILNIHPSLLPRWRGASPIPFSILFDDKITGVTLMRILPKNFDVGPILAQKQFIIPKSVTSLQLLYHLSHIGNELIQNLVINFDETLNKSISQSNSNVTYAHKITSEMMFIDWKNQSSHEVDCQYRALGEFSHLKSIFNNNVIKFMDLVHENNPISSDFEFLKPGEAVFDKKNHILNIKCKNGFIGFKNVIYKKKLKAIDFYNGYMHDKSIISFDSVNNTIKDHIYDAKIILNKK